MKKDKKKNLSCKIIPLWSQTNSFGAGPTDARRIKAGLKTIFSAKFP
jgi:hypothetical protein